MKIKGKLLFLKKDCISLSIYEFCSIIKHQDFRYLIKGFNEDNENDYLKYKDNEELSKVFQELLVEYKEIVNDLSQFKKEKERLLLDIYSQEYDVIVKILDIYKDSKSIEVLGLLNDLGFKIDVSKPIGKQLDVVLKKLIGMKNTINIREAKFKKKYKEDEEDNIEDSSSSILIDLEKKALMLELQLGLSRPIKTKKTSVVQWVNLLDTAEAKEQANG